METETAIAELNDSLSFLPSCPSYRYPNCLRTLNSKAYESSREAVSRLALPPSPRTALRLPLGSQTICDNIEQSVSVFLRWRIAEERRYSVSCFRKSCRQVI